MINEQLGVKVRPIELSLLQRCASHCGSQRDVDEAFNAGKMAVQYAVNGETDKMVIFERKNQKEYEIEYKLVDLLYAANTEKKVPLEWINEAHNGVNEKFVEYALPLIQGKLEFPLEDGLPRFAHLKKVMVK